jgi:hypothetical protein
MAEAERKIMNAHASWMVCSAAFLTRRSQPQTQSQTRSGNVDIDPVLFCERRIVNSHTGAGGQRAEND